MAKFAVILPAAGKSTRFQSHKRKKPFIEMKGRAVWLRALEYFINRDDVVQSIVAVGPDDLEWFKEKFRPNLAFLDVEIVTGGTERADTVQNALARVRSDIDFVVIHDAARPLLAKAWIDRVFAAAEKSGAAILAIPVTSTLKRGKQDQPIDQTVSRTDLWAAQTPQVFRRHLLLDAFARRGDLQGDLQATDEAMLVEQLGQPVTLVNGSPMNLKITTEEDFKMAESLLNALPKEKTLKSIHPFADEDGIKW